MNKLLFDIIKDCYHNINRQSNQVGKIREIMGFFTIQSVSLIRVNYNNR